MLKSLLWITAAVTCTVFMSPAALADDAYICDGGRLVYARPETIEKLKQTDPCIQGYYATVPAAPSTPTSAANLTPPQTPQALTPPVPPSETAKNKSPAAKHAPLKGATRDAELQNVRPKPMQAKAPAAAPGTDFRNVRVINAPAPGASVYHHQR